MRTYAIALTAALTMSAACSISQAQASETDQAAWIAPPAATGSCAFSKTEISSSTQEQTTTSASFVNLGDGGSISFNQIKTGCIAGTFFGNAGNTTSNDNVVMQITLDGTPCTPLTGGYVFANSGVDLSPHSVAFFCSTAAAPGSHTVQVQWAAGVGGEAVIFQHTLEVNHR